MNVLISSAGRRVGLLECFRSALGALDANGKIIAADASDTAPALHFADETCTVPRCDNPQFIPALVEACAAHHVDAIVPTIDTELAVLAAHRDELQSTGAALWLSSCETIEISADKRETNRWLHNNGFPAVSQFTPFEALEQVSALPFPLIAKPARGSASVGVKRIHNRAELEACLNRDLVIETLAPGVEYTVHVWAGAKGRALCAVPCRRLEVRAGEVSKGRTEKHDGLMQLASEVVDALPGCRGPLNVQIFLDPTAGMRVIEINPRFGGGYPLADRAGARFTKWMIDPSASPIHYYDGWVDGLTMLRYDSAVYTLPDAPSNPDTKAVHASSDLLRTRS
ncbi:MAG: ATP-grasp domain-containing protein [Acidobacteria bacterium]|nr:ATP-grasp domain-containing protein [Acidobacteriota bacterium]